MKQAEGRASNLGPGTTDATTSSASRTGLMRRRRFDVDAALAGVAAAAVAIAASELLAGLISGVPSLVVGIGSLVIALQPPGAKDFVASLFGTNDKLALNIAIVLVALLLAAWAGIAARRNFQTAVSIFVAFGLISLIASIFAAVAAPLGAVASATVAVVTGLYTLRFLIRRLPSLSGQPGQPGRGDAGAVASRAAGTMPNWDRRRFLLTSGGFVGASLGVGLFGRRLLEGQHPGTAPVSAVLPRPATAVPAPFPDQSLSVPGITPIVIPNNQFYRIDTALLVPQVNAATWSLKVDGLVDHPLVFTYADLLQMPLFEQYITIQCVSNYVGGDLVGNTKWTGVHLKEVLANAGIQNGATQIVGRSVDGFTVGFPTAWALDPSREPMIAVGMNDAPLPAEHGYPARLIVPGLYGYVSATKWLAEIELTTWEAFNAYWINLGWAKEGPILTQSRIDVPHDGQRLKAGPIQIAGVAWAPDRGVSKVEISIDRGEWQSCQLSRAISKATWVQWVLLWDATPGQHSIEVRTTDGTGEVQTADITPPAPDGARGHDQINVSVG